MCSATWAMIGAILGLSAGLLIAWIVRMTARAVSLKTVGQIGIILCGVLGGAAGYMLSGRCVARHDGQVEPAVKTESALMQVETAEQFDSAVIHSARPVVVDFSAAWCPPCREQSKILDELAGKYAGKASFVKVDVDKLQTVAQKYGVQLLPTIYLFANGKSADKWEGLTKGQKISAAIDAALSGRPSTQPVSLSDTAEERIDQVTVNTRDE